MDTKRNFFTLQWHITHRCNLRCTHCYQDDYTAFASWSALESVLVQYEKLLRTYRFKGYLNVTGGEPLTHPALFRLLKAARDRDITAAVLTNGTMIGSYEAKMLRSCGVYYVQVSLDGTEKTHDAIRGKGSFRQAIEGIRCLLAQRIYTTVSFTAQRNNIGELPKLARLCREIGVNKLWFDRVVIPIDEDVDRLSLTGDEYFQLLRRAAKLNKKHMVSCARALQFIPCEEKCVYHCTAGKNLLTVLADGSVMACRRLPIIAGNVHDSDLSTIYRDSPDIIRLKNAPIPSQCQKCGYADLCGGGAKCITYARTGRYDLPDPDCPLISRSFKGEFL